LGDIETGQRGIAMGMKPETLFYWSMVKILPPRLPARVGKVDHYWASEVTVT
jgi:hypothetical protein